MVNVLPPVAELKRIALDLLFPRYCINCGREGDFVCEQCRLSLTYIIPPICGKCGRPLSGKLICNRCISEQGDIDGIRAPFSFGGIVRQCIHKFKYENIRALAGSLSIFLYDCLQNNNISADVIVPEVCPASNLKSPFSSLETLESSAPSNKSSVPV